MKNKSEEISLEIAVCCFSICLNDIIWGIVQFMPAKRSLKTKKGKKKKT